ncbi:M28 family peptidase [Algibacter aquimarinus]|uniref:M20/M25/M40 family metallo-hydrolase n=1 Tax=Algibacter aquimarinus TaxID=1136748 RepID=A0ABP9HAV3_9FLAO
MNFKSISFSFFLLFLISFFGVNAQNIEVNNVCLFNETNLLKNLKTLSSDFYEGRRTGTVGAKRAKKYIINQFYKLGVLKKGKSYEQPFRFYHRGQYYDGVNVLGFIKGTSLSKKHIVISAHYDHEGIKQGEIYNGADDNASGVSALFAFAEYYKKYPPKHSIILAAFDAEELGLRGSKYFVNNTSLNLKTISLNVNLDMISRSDKNQLYVAGTAYNKSLKYVLSNSKKSKKISVLPGHDGYDGLDNWTYASDHANFHKKEIPFLYFGVEDHKDYHEPTDDFENINPKFYVEAVKSIILILNKIDNSNF